MDAGAFEQRRQCKVQSDVSFICSLRPNCRLPRRSFVPDQDDLSLGARHRRVEQCPVAKSIVGNGDDDAGPLSAFLDGRDSPSPCWARLVVLSIHIGQRRVQVGLIQAPYVRVVCPAGELFQEASVLRL